MPSKKTSTSPVTVRPKRPRRTVGSAPAQPAITAADIARRAYELYESRGRIDGAHFDDWLEAERQLLNGAGA